MAQVKAETLRLLHAEYRVYIAVIIICLPNFEFLLQR